MRHILSAVGLPDHGRLPDAIAVRRTASGLRRGAIGGGSLRGADSLRPLLRLALLPHLSVRPVRLQPEARAGLGTVAQVPQVGLREVPRLPSQMRIAGSHRVPGSDADGHRGRVRVCLPGGRVSRLLRRPDRPGRNL